MESIGQLEYLSIGGNRHPAAADWTSHHGGLVAFGAGNNIALWNPLVCNTQVCTFKMLTMLEF
jgi:elongator complex protein 2